MIKRCIIVSLLFLVICCVNAQTYFGNQNVIIQSTRNGARSVYACDIDGDGDQDILSASSSDDKITWYENTDGNGTFEAQQVITTSANSARSVYACDLDGDGDQDVLSASYYDDKIAWYENTDGNGTFGAQQVITTSADYAYSVYACDLDGDGDQDVLSASHPDDKIAWYENTDGKGTFGAQQVITTSTNGARSVYACDLDGDGDQDVLSASSYDDKIAWYENTDGNGTFEAQQVISTSADNASSVYACDIDGDGDQDVLSASEDDDKIAWYENTDGYGTFGAQQVITTSADEAHSVYACDMDGDGDQDVLSASNRDDKIAWYENTDGNGTFGAQQVISTSAINAKSVYACDIDGDGDQDVLSASSYDDKIAWYENTDGNGTFGAQQVITTYAYGAQSVYACDIDGDGDQDVLSASREDDKIAWYENTDGNGTFVAQRVISTSAEGARSVFACDIDGDGDQDVLSASGGIGLDKIAWYENTDGKGTFGAQQVISTSADYAYSVYACDIDGDGDQDVLSASRFDNKIAWYENTDGNGTFETQRVITTSAEVACSVYACDIDGDGDQDILSASLADDKIAWYENTDGNGTFGAQQVISTYADGARSVYACDIDGDGDQDVLSASREDDKIAWYENINGNGAFGEQQIITTSANYAVSVYACDIDLDGDQDVLSASSRDNKIAWYENTDGNGTFGAQRAITTSAYYAESVYACDIDGDGDQDVLSASLSDDKIAWYENFTAIIPAILKQPTDENICPDSDAEFSLTADDVETYQWQVNEGTGYSDLSNNSLYSGATTNRLTISSAGIDMNGYTYRCVLSNPRGSIHSDEAVLTVEDITNPAISCVSNQSVDANVTHYYTVIGTEFDPVETNDNCGIASVENDFNNTATLEGAQIPEGTSTIIWIIKDNAGNENTCSFDINVNAYSVGVETIQQKGISIYPNPTTGILYCEFAYNNIQKLTISEITGNQIIAKTQIQQNEAIDLSGFASGIYIISIQTDKEILTIKIIRE